MLPYCRVARSSLYTLTILMRRAGDYYGPDGHIFYIAMRLPNLRDNKEEIIKETVARDLYNIFFESALSRLLLTFCAINF